MNQSLKETSDENRGFMVPIKKINSSINAPTIKDYTEPNTTILETDIDAIMLYINFGGTYYDAPQTTGHYQTHTSWSFYLNDERILIRGYPSYATGANAEYWPGRIYLGEMADYGNLNVAYPITDLYDLDGSLNGWFSPNIAHQNKWYGYFRFKPVPKSSNVWYGIWHPTKGRIKGRLKIVWENGGYKADVHADIEGVTLENF